MSRFYLVRWAQYEVNTITFAAGHISWTKIILYSRILIECGLLDAYFVVGW